MRSLKDECAKLNYNAQFNNMMRKKCAKFVDVNVK